jgi:hypothetical protein
VEVPVVPSVNLDGTAIKALVAELKTARDARKALDAQEAATKDAIYSLMGWVKVGDAWVGVNEVGYLMGVEIVKIAHRATTNLDREMIKKEFPAVYEQALKTNKYTKIEI